MNRIKKIMAGRYEDITNNDIDWLIDVAEAAEDLVDYMQDMELPKGALVHYDYLRKALEAGDD